MATLGSLNSVATSLVVRKRDGQLVVFDAQRIAQAIEKAFRADAGLYEGEPMPTGQAREVQRLAGAVTDRCLDLVAVGQTLDVEGIQDLVERELMRAIHHGAARRYILYREERRRAREARL